MQDNNFHKILSNSASEAEKVEFFEMIENDAIKRAEFLELKNLYVISNSKQNIHSKSDKNNFNRFWNHVHPSTTQRMLYQWMKYAAIVVVALLVGFMAHYLQCDNNILETNRSIRYATSKGSISSVLLDDGSTIWLSSGTQFSIDINATGEMVAKLDGEAYFDMIPDPNRNFELDLGKFKVKDIGTKFNVRAYDEEPIITTSLLDGQVDLFDHSGKILELKEQGESVVYDKMRKSLLVGKLEPFVIAAWKDGKFVFIDQTLSEICKELENWYDVEISIEDKSLANLRYTSVIKRSTTVKMVLEILTVTDHIKYEITDMKEGKDRIIIRR